MSAPITKQHLKIIDEIRVGDRSMRFDITDAQAAQLIADSEAKAINAAFPDSGDDSLYNVRRLRAELARLDTEKPWLKEANATVAKLRAEVERLTAEVANQKVQNNHNWQFQEISEEALKRAERAEAELKKWSLLNLWGGTPEIIHAFIKGQQNRICAAEKAEAELADIRALANRRNKRDHSQDTTHQLVAALDQALDIAQAELATERARIADLVADLNDACITLTSAEEDCDDYAMQNTRFKLTAVREVLLQHIPNAAMKEGA